MNYIKMYTDFIEYCKTTEVNDRISNRSKLDFRIGCDYIYMENHHIIPIHDGGYDTEDNMIMLLPEEHITAHKIRWKALKQRGDMLAVRFCLNGIKNPKNIKLDEIKDNLLISKSLRQGYIWLKQNSAEVRKTHGWQTPDGIKRISEARKGKMPVKDSFGNMIGSVDINHPKVLSGEWVHHSKGVALSINHRKKISDNGRGLNNGNSSNVTDAEIYDWHFELSLELGFIPSLNILRKYVKSKYNRNIPKSFRPFRFNNGKYDMIVIENKTNMIYTPYIRGENLKKQRLKLKELL